MANLSFMSQLTDEQRRFADVIRERALQMGIPPELAVSVAYQESRLNPQPKDSGKGAIGIMQVRPIAARDVGINPNELRDPNVNIDAGLRYLKKALTETGDPRAAVVYYNAGPATYSAFNNGGDLPQETEKYLKSLYGYGAFKPPAAEPTAERASEPAAEATGGYELPARVNFKNRTAEQQKAEQASLNEQEKHLAQLYGLGAGATISGFKAGASGALAGVKNVGQALTQGMAAGAPGAAVAPSAPPAVGAAPVGAPSGLAAPTPAAAAVPQGGAPTTPAGGTAAAAVRPDTSIPTMEQATRMSAGTTGDLGTTGRQRMQTFNERTAQQAARAKEATRTVDQLVQAGVAPKTASQVLAEASDFTTSRGGVAIPQSLVAELAAEEAAPARQMSPLEQARERQRLARASLQAQSVGQQVGALPPTTVPAAPVQGSIPLPAATTRPSGLEQVTQMFARAAQQPLVSGALRYGLPPLAAAGGAGQLMGAKQAFDEGDYLGAALEGIGGAASLASLFPAAAPIGVPVSLAASGINALRKVEPTPFDVESERMTAQEYNRLFGGRLTPEREYRTYGQRARGALR